MRHSQGARQKDKLKGSDWDREFDGNLLQVLFSTT